MTQTTIIPEHMERIAIDALLPYARNARTHSDGQVEQLVASIREFGFTNPILADPFGVLDHDDTCRADRQWRTGHDPDRLAGLEHMFAVGSGGDLAHHGQFDRLLGGTDRVGSDDRITIDRCVVEGRNLFGRHHVGGQHEAFCLREIDLDRVEGRAGPEHERLGVFEWRHALHGIGCTVLVDASARQTGQVSDGTTPLPFPADGFTATWATWDTGHHETVTISWENEAWTVSGAVGREDVQYVIRLTPFWQVSQFLLFRDLDEPDLWLGTDGRGRWGEVNGAHRPDLDGHRDLWLPCTPVSHSLPIRRLPLAVGEAIDFSVLRVDVETLGIVPISSVYERVADRLWRATHDDTVIEFEVDEFGLPRDIDGQYRRS